ncbi:MAG TPA: ATP-binding protein [Verrucomicrobiae bacterium]|nr:ATP-binding protein [Verrucomicrobiae bacterium]
MSEVTQKTEVGKIDGTPEKRMFWSIMSDYDLTTGICELVDNAIDIWMRQKPRGSLLLQLWLDPDRQFIIVKDNAGGVSQADLRLLVTPGASTNDPNFESIGYFGVGSKRAVVALAEQVVIKTREKDGKSYQLDISKDWLEMPTWEMPAYEIPSIDPGITIIELSQLKHTVSQSDIDHLLIHLGQTYEWFLQIDGCRIEVNEVTIQPLSFEKWAFPPEHRPRQAPFDVGLSGHGKLGVEITAGLILDRDPEADNYGVYFYCNNRLIVKELKVRDVGYFVTTEAGVPHPDASLCRVIVRFNGKAKLMPWTSSKTGINFSHPAFQQIRPTLIQLVSHFTALSRRTKDDWQGKVLSHADGEIERMSPSDMAQGKKLILPPLPRVNKPHVEQLKAKNKNQIKDQPWTLGLVEAIAAVDLVSKQKQLSTRSRIALILLDSNFEIALKEFVVHRDDLFPNVNLKALFEKRHFVIDAVSKKVSIPPKLLEKAKHYYGLRNKLVHERASAEVTPDDIENYSETVQQILKILFDLDF